MKIFLKLMAIGLFGLAVGCGGSDQSEKADKEPKDTVVKKTVERIMSIGGTYTFGSDVKKGPVGSLKIYPISEDAALFYLDVNRGAPSYNMGLLAGEMKRNNGVWTYGAGDGKADCTLQFNFDNGMVKVAVISGQQTCGFGAGVDVSNNYQIVDRNVPSFFINGEGDTVRFADLKPTPQPL